MPTKTKLSPAQLTRRQTLYPLNARQVASSRAMIAAKLAEWGFSVREIRQVLTLSGPDKARTLVAKGRRQFQKLTELER